MLAMKQKSAAKKPVRLSRLPGYIAAQPSTLATALVLGLTVIVSALPLAAQTIALNVSDSARVFVAPSAKLTVPVSVDLTAAGALNLASLQAGLTWGASRLTFDSIRVVPSTGFSLTPNTGSTATGSLTFNTFSATALATSGPLFNVYFTAGATSGGTHVALAPTVAATDLAQDILSHLAVRNVDVCVAAQGTWGDVTKDGLVNIVDAQQIARYSVGLPVADSAATRTRGDVTADGAVNIIDAQQIARYSVALSAAARVSTSWLSAAPVAAVAVTPAADTLAGGQTVALNAALLDSTTASVAGCYPITWTSSNPQIALVDTTGVVTGVASGTVTITATAAGVSGTATVTEAAPAPTPAQSGLYANQPAGLTRFAEVDFSSLPDVGGRPGVVAGNWWWYEDAPYHLTVVSDPTAPQSASSVLQVDFEAGTEPGYDTQNQSVRLFGGWTTTDELNNTEYSEIYESTWFKIPTADFETQEVGVKLLGYWGVGMNNQGHPSQLLSLITGNGTGTALMSSWTLDMGQQDAVSRYLPQNVNLSKQVTAGSWHQFEAHMKLNTLGQANGVWEWWLDGVLIGHYSDVTFAVSGAASGFYGRRFDAVWGGGGGTAKSRTDYVWLDHMYLSGKP
jgi:hypothetical protein